MARVRRKVSGTFCFTGAIDVVQGTVVRRSISALIIRVFFLLKTFLQIIFSVIFKSIQSSTRYCEKQTVDNVLDVIINFIYWEFHIWTITESYYKIKLSLASLVNLC